MITQDEIITRFLEQSAEYFGLGTAVLNETAESETITVPGYMLCNTAHHQRQTLGVI
jgi:hypothetical protein